MGTLRELCILCLLTIGYADYLVYSSAARQQLRPVRSPQQLDASQLQQLVSAVPEESNSTQQRFAPSPIQLQYLQPKLGPSPEYLQSRHHKLQSEQLKPKDPHDGKVYNEVMNMHESIPIPHIKYDKHEAPVLSYGNDGLAEKYGDRKVLHGEFPYYAQVRYDDIFICGAVLVRSPVTRKQVIISATHCLVEAFSSKLSDHRRFTLRMGVVGRNEEGQTRGVKQLLVHPGYTLYGPSRRAIFHDIGLIIPDSEFELNANVSTISLPVSPIPFRGDIVIIKGFGKGREPGHDGTPRFMRTLQVPVWDLDQCAQIYLNESGSNIITGAHFCASNYLGGVDACQGDSGGPAVSLDKGQMYLSGVVSWGKGCGRPQYPGVYGRLFSYIQWIRNTLYDYEINGIVPTLPKYPQ